MTTNPFNSIPIRIIPGLPDGRIYIVPDRKWLVAEGRFETDEELARRCGMVCCAGSIADVAVAVDEANRERRNLARGVERA